MTKSQIRLFWERQNSETKKKIIIELSKKFGKSIQTIHAWMLGYRKPAKLENEMLKSFIRKNYQTEITDEETQP